MRAFPLDIGIIHFVGIGGIGMSGIAEVLHNLGYSIQGSDLAENANVARLRGLGITIAIGHHEDNLGAAQVVIMSSAVKPDNPEIAAARARFIPVVGRSEMLGELMRLRWSIAVGGTHGKTTTTSMIAAVLDAARYDPTVINGGIINAYGTNARLGGGDWMVVESDESDGSFAKLPSTITVVTNIDPEHLDHYGSFDALRAAFEIFVEAVPFYGFAVMCVDHPEVQALIGRISDRRIITYGYSRQADFCAVEVSADPAGVVFDVIVRGRDGNSDHMIEGVRLPMHGRHNVQNAIAAIALAGEMGIDEDITRRALAGFKGVKHRFTIVGEVGGVTVVDDYGHHPVEIAAVLEAARAVYTGRVIAVVQPHRYSRLRDLFEAFCGCFNDADRVLVADVYGAGEDPIEGIDRDALVAGLRARGHRHAEALADPASLAAVIADTALPGDVVICLGAGTVSRWAEALPTDLEALYAASGAQHQGARR